MQVIKKLLIIIGITIVIIILITITYIINNNSGNNIISNSTNISNDTQDNGSQRLQLYSLSGLVLDKNNNGIPFANVSIWKCIYNDSAKIWENERLISYQETSNNPPEYSFGPVGLFTFFDIPTGMYNITVEKNGYLNYTLSNVDQNTKTCLMMIPGYNGNDSNKVPLPGPNDKGVIWGVVSDQNTVGSNTAEITLWNCAYDKEKNEWINTDLVKIPNNPQMVNKTGRTMGVYKFENVPNGIYNVTAADTMSGRYSNMIVSQDNNVSITFIVVPTPSY